MDFNDIINRFGNQEDNLVLPDNNRDSNVVKLSDIAKAVSTPNGETIGEELSKGVMNFHGLRTDKAYVDQLIKYGITPNRIDDRTPYSYENQLAEHQAASEKWWNSLKRTVVNEVGIGTVKAFSDVVDLVSSKIFNATDDDYTNPVSQTLKEWQDAYEQRNPIFDYHREEGDTWGRFASAGWWANNLPSVMSSLTLLLPAKAVTGTLGLIGKVTNAGRYARGGIRAISGVNKALKGKEGVDRVAALRDLNAFQRGVNSLSNQRMFVQGASELLGGSVMRAVENYQEGQQVYEDINKTAIDEFSKMNDNEFAAWCDNHAELINSMPENVRSNLTRENVANQIAKSAADKTFSEDWYNLIFDISQLHQLKNPTLMLKNMRQTAATRMAERNAKAEIMRAAGKDEEFIRRKLGNKYVNAIKDRTISLSGILGSELSEGIEEGVNYVAQEEGLHYGNVILGKEEPSTYDARWRRYWQSPDLYDSMLWGVLGGVIFNMGGSGVNRLEQGLYKQANKPDKKTGEKTNVADWFDRFELAENKRRTNEINGRMDHANDFKNKLQLIKDHKNPYSVTKAGYDTLEEGSVEEELAIERATNDYVTNITLNALENGNYDMLKAYLQDENVIEAFKELGITDDTSGAYANSLIERMDRVAQSYYNNITLMDNLATGLNEDAKGVIPIEYIQAAAQGNVDMELYAEKAKQTFDRHLAAASGLEEATVPSSDTSDEANKKRAEFAKNRALISASAFETELSQLYADRKEILDDRNKAESIGGQIKLASINKKIRVVQQAMNDARMQVATLNETEQLTARVNSMIYALGFSKSGSTYQFNPNDTRFSRMAKAFATKDASLIRQLSKEFNLFGDDTSLDLTKEQLDELVDKQGLNNFIKSSNKLFDSETGLEKTNPQLYNHYQMAAFAQAEMAYANSERITDVEGLKLFISQQHSIANHMREDATSKAMEKLQRIVDDYGEDVIFDYINNHRLSDVLTEADAKNLKDAIEVYNLTRAENRPLVDIISAAIRAYAQNKFNEEKNSSTFKNSSQSSQTSQPINTSQTASQADTSQANRVQTNSTQTNVNPNDTREVLLKIDNDGNVVTTDDVKKAIHPENLILVPAGTDEADNVNYELTRRKGDNNIDILVKGKRFYDGPSIGNNDNVTINTNPIVQVDDKGIVTVIQKGSYSVSSPSPSSTGGLEENNSSQSKPVIVSKDYLTQEEQATVNADARAEALRTANAEVTKQFALNANELKNPDTAEQTLNDIESWVNDKYTDPDVRNAALKVFNSFAGIIRGKLNTLQQAVGNVIINQGVMHSSVGEYIDKNPKETEDFTKAADKLIRFYIKTLKAKKVNGKYIVNLEQLLRYVDANYDANTGVFIFDSMKAYLESNVGKEKYFVSDENINAVGNNLGKTIETRSQEINISNKINITDEINEAHEAIKRGDNEKANKFFEALNSARPGDKLKVKRIAEGRLGLIASNGAILGTLPITKIENGSDFVAINRFWKYQIPINGDVKNTPLNMWLKRMLTETENGNLVHEELNNILYYVAINKNIPKEEFDEVFDAFKNNEDIKEAQRNGLLTATTDKELVAALNHIASIYRFTASTDAWNLEESSEHVSKTLDSWFEKLYNSYKAVENLVQKDENEVTISVVDSGEIIEAEDSENYDNYNNSSEAIAEPENAVLAIVYTPRGKNGNSVKTLTDVHGKTHEISAKTPNGTLYYMIKNANGTDGYIKAVTTRLSDKKVKGFASQLYKDIDRVFNELMFGSKEVNMSSLLSSTLPALLGDGFMYNSFMRVEVDNGAIILKNSNTKDYTFAVVINSDGKTKQYRVRNEDGSYINYSFEDAKNNKEVYDGIKKEIDKFRNGFSFSIPYSFRASSIPNFRHESNGYIADNRLKKITLSFADVDGTPIKHTFDGSIDEFLMNSGIIKVNTHIEDGSNWAHTPKRSHKAAQKVEINMSVASTPVEEVINDNASGVPRTTNEIITATKQIISDDSKKEKGSEIIKSIFADKMIEGLTEVGRNNKTGFGRRGKVRSVFDVVDVLQQAGMRLLPRTIVYDDNNDYIGENEAASNNNVVYIGNKWVSIAQNNPSRAIRLLIHEQIHLNINNLSEEDRNNLFNSINSVIKQFEDYVNNTNNTRLQRFLFSDVYDNEQDRIEEFIVESLTNIELIDALNSIKSNNTTSEENNSLWSQIIKLLGKLFGWKAKKGYLYYEELQSLGRVLNKATNSNSNVNTDDATKTVSNNNGEQLEFNFNEVTPENTTLGDDLPEYRPSSRVESDDFMNEDWTTDDEEDNYNIKRSSAGEYVQSISTMIEHQDLADRLALARSIERGDISISCR